MSSEDSDERKSRRERKKEDRREDIKQSAIMVFSEKGYHSAKVSQIVDHVGVAQGTFYLYFEGKQQLFSEILNDFLSMLVETIASWEPAELDSREALRSELRRVGLMLTDALMENRELTAIFFNESLAVAPELQKLIREFYDTLGSMLTSFNRILHERGLIGNMNYEVLAYMTIGMVERVIEEYVVYETFEDVSPGELVDNLIAHYLAGTSDQVEEAMDKE